MRISFSPACLRTTAGLTGKPLCPSKPASEITISNGSATAGNYFVASGSHKAGEQSCTGQTISGECWAYANIGDSVTLTAKIDGPVPAGDTLRLAYVPGYAGEPKPTCVAIDSGSGDCILAQTTSAESVQATVKLPPDKSRTHSVIAKVELLTPAGQAVRALGIGLCDPSKHETAPDC